MLEIGVVADMVYMCIVHVGVFIYLLFILCVRMSKGDVYIYIIYEVLSVGLCV